MFIQNLSWLCHIFHTSNKKSNKKKQSPYQACQICIEILQKPHLLCLVSRQVGLGRAFFPRGLFLCFQVFAWTQLVNPLAECFALLGGYLSCLSVSILVRLVHFGRETRREGVQGSGLVYVKDKEAVLVFFSLLKTAIQFPPFLLLLF